MYRIKIKDNLKHSQCLHGVSRCNQSFNIVDEAIYDVASLSLHFWPHPKLLTHIHEEQEGSFFQPWCGFLGTHSSVWVALSARDALFFPLDIANCPEPCGL